MLQKFHCVKSVQIRTRKYSVFGQFSHSVLLLLINRHFPKSHRLHKIFNRNTVKVSYSCIQNMSKIYKGYNCKISSTPCNQRTLCNCRVKIECLMNGKCQTMDAVYDYRVTSSEPQKISFGLAEGKWNKRYYNHKKSFNHKRYSHETTLSSYVWHLKKTLDVTLNLKRSVVKCATLYSNISKKCLLCLYEKLVIITYPKQHELLNKRSELFCYISLLAF